MGYARSRSRRHCVNNGKQRACTHVRHGKGAATEEDRLLGLGQRRERTKGEKRGAPSERVAPRQQAFLFDRGTTRFVCVPVK